MMPGCSSYEGGHVMGACSCGMFHSQTNSFPMLFGNSTNQYNPYDDHEYSDMYNSFTPSSSSVDCTLSLGTPSTRLTEDEEKRTSSSRSLCWDLLRSKHSHTNKSTRGSSSSSSSSNNDPLLARRCANCDTTSTPLWRNGPRGPKSLCNACGIRYKKEERRAAAAASTATASASGGVMESAGMYGGGGHHTNYWYAQSHDGDGESENGIPFLSWRLNVTDNRGLVHDFTR